MIYLVSSNRELFDNDFYEIMTVEESVKVMQNWDTIQFDTETSGRDPHICKLLCMQFGNDAADMQIVVDCQCIDPIIYKDILESKLIIGQNLKFDLQFLYNYEIIPLHVYDTMIVEQLLYLGFPYVALSPSEYTEYQHDFPYLITTNEKTGNVTYNLSFSLKAIAQKRLNLNIDKTVRGEIIWRGLDTSVILYAAGDVTYLEKIKDSQEQDCIIKQCTTGAYLENNFVPVNAYLEWCGIKIDEEKWKQKMQKDKLGMDTALEGLKQFVLKTPILKDKFTYMDLQGDLFLGFQTEPTLKINWSSSVQVIQVAQLLGFNTNIKDPKNGEDKDSVLEKELSVQKGINDEFLSLYFKYKECQKLVSSFGQGHLNTINPNTGRSHTSWKQLGAASGRMSCGSSQPNSDLARLKCIPEKKCTFPNYQQLPHDAFTRSCFIPEQGNLWVSCDYSAMEARLAGDIYNDQAVKDIFLKGIDSHSMYAKIFFQQQLKDVDVNDIKRLYPELRNLAKGPEFALNFGGGVSTIMKSLQCSKEEATQIVKNYEQGFKGTATFAKKGSLFVRNNGYVLINPITGHKMYWWDFKKWKSIEDFYKSDQWDWETYKMYHKGTNDVVDKSVQEHRKAGAKWDRMARNAPTQGTGAVILKHSQIALFHWVVKNGYFGKVKLCALVHDEANWEYPKELEEFPSLLQKSMEKAAAIYCQSLPIPAEPDIAECWKH